MKIIPTIFAHNKKEFHERFEKLVPIANYFQIDFMDAKFVPAKSMQLKDVPTLPKNKNFEAHLMCLNPENYFKALKKKGFKKIIFHIETTSGPEKLIKKIKTLGMKSMVAINPETSLEKIPKNSDVMFMGVHPGKEHQTFIPEVYDKIAELRSQDKTCFIQVDGGITPEVIKKLARLKVNAVNSGSFISSSPNPKKSLKELKSLSRNLF